MSGFENFLWGIAPYISFTILIVGTIIRRVFFARTWTAKSSEFLDKGGERLFTPLFHLAILFILFGHIGGVLVPKTLVDGMMATFMGFDEPTAEHMYHLMAFGMGGLFGIVCGIAVIMLLKRRFGPGNDYMKANTSTMDKVMYVFLALTIAFGLIATFTNAGGDFNYRESLSPWFRSVLALQPQTQLMASVPIFFKLHMCCWMCLFAVLPFTRLVHMFSGVTAPFRYAKRKDILYRRRDIPQPVRDDQRALEFPKGVTRS
jgi:nitrate reductase gamma subunit